MKFVTALALHRASVAQWYSIEMLRIFLCPTLTTRQTGIFFHFFAKLKTNHLSHSNYKNTNVTEYIFILNTTLNILSLIFVQIQTN